MTEASSHWEEPVQGWGGISSFRGLWKEEIHHHTGFTYVVLSLCYLGKVSNYYSTNV